MSGAGGMAKFSPFAPEYRASGLLLHVTSLPSPYGIGDLGSSAFLWVNRLHDAGQAWWQALPLGPTGYGNSPYQSLSSFAGNGLLISPCCLISDGLLPASDCESHFPSDVVDYDSIIPFKQRLLEKAWTKFKAGERKDLWPAYDEFCTTQANWLEDYALFRALKSKFEGAYYLEWPEELVQRREDALVKAKRELATQIDQFRLEQFLLLRQADHLKEHAHAKGVSLIGDLPFFVSPDSSDVWANPELFLLDEQRRPRFVAGVPPDYFSAQGQLWGNPVYNWDALRSTGYRWCIDRLRALLSHVDVIRLDHFLGFAAAWHVPAGAATAQSGQWEPGPGDGFFRAVQRELGCLPFIAEDLGVITQNVVALRDQFQVPGTRVLQFAFDGHADNPYLPHNFVTNTVAYTGTHDNAPTRQWYEELPNSQRQNLWSYLKRAPGDSAEAAPALMRLAWSSVAGLTIAPLQDLLGLGIGSRMNVPGSANGNWRWRCPEDTLCSPAFEWLQELTESSKRSAGPRISAQLMQQESSRFAPENCYRPLDAATSSRDGVNNSPYEVLAEVDCPSGATQSVAVAPPNRPTWAQTEGSPLPLGVTWVKEDQAFNFAVHAEQAESVTLFLYSPTDLVNPVLAFRFDFLRNKSGRIWHCRIPFRDIGDARYYAYSVSGQTAPQLRRFDPQKVLLDPYAKCVFFPPNFDPELAKREGPNAGRAPLGVLPGHDPAFDWAGDRQPRPESDAIIYELHVKGFTKNPNSGVHPSRAGTYAGLVEKIPYLKELGITVVELMPIFQRDPHEDDYWGYMPLNFFAPHAQYASTCDNDDQQLEFRNMVKSFHKAGIAVVLDVVYNHTCEGDHRGPIYSFKGFDSAGYYMQSSDPANPYANYSGTGNTLNFGQAHVRKMVMDSLRYWTREMHIDGFRFDLASVFSRNADGSLNWRDAPIFSEIAADPELGQLKLIAEPWDTSAYQLGRGFPGLTWLQWNGRFRDDVRRFIKGDRGMVPDVMRRIYGSDDLFPDGRADAYHAYQSTNFITCHDGFTLYDLVSYDRKRNWKNGNNNQDGMDDNYSWNCGHEGEEGLPSAVLALRRKQVKNFCCLLLLSNGIPMLRAGDEFLNTQFGNNNPYNQDNEIGWLDWSQLRANQDIFRFFKNMIAFRKNHPSLSRSRFWREDVSWYGTGPTVDLSGDSRSLAFCLHDPSQGDDDIYVMINAYWEELEFHVQEGTAQEWKRIVDTALASPDDFSDYGVPLAQTKYRVAPRSIVVLLRPRGSSRRS